MSEIPNTDVPGNELTHHGIVGQKWGVRRYQNSDGSLTALGKRRLVKADGNPTTLGKLYFNGVYESNMRAALKDSKVADAAKKDRIEKNKAETYNKMYNSSKGSSERSKAESESKFTAFREKLQRLSDSVARLDEFKNSPYYTAAKDFESKYNMNSWSSSAQKWNKGTAEGKWAPIDSMVADSAEARKYMS